MFAKLITIAIDIATLASAAPVRRDWSAYVQISVDIASGMDDPIYTMFYANIGQLTSLDEISASGPQLNDWNEHYVNVYNVQCRAYKDEDGLEPASLPFAVGSPAMLSTNLVTVGSMLCYVVEAAEIATTS